MKIMAGNSNLPLARAIAAYLELPLTDAAVRRFADEEVFVEIHENVRGEDVFLMPVTAHGDHVRMFDKQQMIHALAALAFFGDALLNRERFGVTHAAEIADDAGAGHR